MVEHPKSDDLLVESCLKDLGIFSRVDWDVLVFLYRHQTSLTSAEQIARLLGYSSSVVGDALDNLESIQLVQRSRASLGVRFYQFIISEANRLPESCFSRLMGLAANRTGRLLLAKKLREYSTLQVAEKGAKDG